MLDPNDITDLTVIVALADHLGGPHSTDTGKGILADELVSMIQRGLLTIDVRNGVHAGRADAYLAVNMNDELLTVPVSDLNLPNDLSLEWPARSQNPDQT